MPLLFQRSMNLRKQLSIFSLSKGLFEDLVSDRIIKKGKVICSTHLFFIAGLPKSGTTWLSQLLTTAPGIVKLNGSMIRRYPKNPKLVNVHDVSHEMLTCAPKNCLSLLKLHLNPYPRNFSILENHDIRTVVLIRDLRDVLISRLYHILLWKSHWDNKRLVNLPQEERLLESMKGVIPELDVYVIDYFKSWISGWIDRAEAYPEDTLIIKYEEMKTDLFSVMKRIFSFYEYKVTDEDIRKVISKQNRIQKKHRKRELKMNLKLTGRAHSTFRKGLTGEWRNEFNQEIKEFIKEHAGDILIKSGYENDLSW